MRRKYNPITVVERYAFHWQECDSCKDKIRFETIFRIKDFTRASLWNRPFEFTLCSNCCTDKENAIVQYIELTQKPPTPPQGGTGEINPINSSGIKIIKENGDIT